MVSVVSSLLMPIINCVLSFAPQIMSIMLLLLLLFRNFFRAWFARKPEAQSLSFTVLGNLYNQILICA